MFFAGYVSKEEKENINILEEEKALEVPSKRRPLQSSTLQCRHCHETFTSKISFRIHQRKHTEEARKRGTMDGEEPLRPILQEKKSQPRKIMARKRRRPFGRGPERLLTLASCDWSDQSKECVPNDETRHTLTHNTVMAVKALLNATKDERSKRGKYIKYTQELRDDIAQYALSHGNHEATVHWSHRLGGTVSESTIRNFIKTYKKFTIEVKEEIGKFAFQYGLDEASKHYSDKLGYEVRKGLVRKFKKNYLKKFPDIGDMGGELPGGTVGKRVNLPSTSARQKRSYSLQMKDEIGRYAMQYGINAAIQHYTEKLQFSVKESTVRKFKKQYFDRGNSENGSVTVTSGGSDNTGVVGGGGGGGTVLQDHQAPQTIDVLHPSLSVLNAQAVSGTVNVSTANNFVYQHPYHLNMTPGPQTNTVLPMNHNSIAFHQGGVINQGMTASLSYQQTGTPPGPSVIMNQSFAHQTPTGFQQGYVGGFTQGSGGGGSVVHGGQIGPLAMTHASVAATTMAHSPLPLTMAGTPATHMPQLSHHGVVTPASQAHLVQAPAAPHTVSAQHPTHHQLITSFHQPLAGSLSFEGTALPAHGQTSVNSEPLSLMKETHEQPAGVSLGQGDDSLHGPGGDGGAAHPGLAHLGGDQPCTSDQHDTILGMDYDDDFSDPPTPRKKKGKGGRMRAKARMLGMSKRGHYASYSPELRAEIGRYATKHGNLAAVHHFKEQLGFDIPESTIRGLKDKYLIKRARGKKEVVSIGFAQRGRPMRLGKYDEIVQDCIRQLVKDGEKVSSFLAIATAKQVLMQYQPSLLEEHGGPVRLNPTWAKSFLKQAVLAGVGQTILVLSGKGGVGKSTAAVQLAATLRAQGRRVGLLDVDLCGPSIPRMLGVEGKDVLTTPEGKWVPVSVDEEERLKVISIAFFLDSKNDAIIWRGPKKNAMIKQLLTSVLWDVDYLIIDTPPGTSDEHISVMENIKGVPVMGAVLVTTPQMVAVDDVTRELTFCRRTGITILGIIENMSGFVCPTCSECSNILASGGGQQLAEKAGVAFLGRIPIDPTLSRCAEEGLNYIDKFSSSPISQIYHSIIHKLTGTTEEEMDIEK
ncbi:Cytosolic Fe-S cluster assembly factor NUBP2 [Chionoecetes opilio]|uniref:Cytosolic Fe-S cluster assembly factor NUBP2 n=1 Tax=Chionoecetes opilio TaxID=41210 RepID=A0A8J4YJT9_CHIOP|nr:Cytosolic Fe-S cluster assembly factor NUBP2 [Chionoecetes opilio]